MKQSDKKKKIIRTSTVPESLNVFLKGFLKVLSTKYDVIAVSSSGESLKEINQREGVRTVSVEMQRQISLWQDFISLFKLIILFARERPTMVHSMTPKAGLLSMLAAKLTGVPVRVHTFTGLIFPTATGIKRCILILMDKIICYCATYINPEGQGVSNDLKKYKITSKNLHIIANGNVRGIDLEWYSRSNDVCKEAEKIQSPDKFTFCFVGRLVGDKGVNELVNAFDRLSEINKNVRLLLIGGLEHQLDPLHSNTLIRIKENVQIDCFGQVKDVRPYLVAADVFILPSYREGFPNSVLEAGALGLASIVTDISGSNEIIESGVNGQVIPSRDSKALFDVMTHWTENPELVKSMGLRAREVVTEKFDQVIIRHALLAKYDELMGDL